jgi:hypothetical protein
MCNFLTVLSAVALLHMPLPLDVGILVSVAECAKSTAALKRVLRIIKYSGVEKIFLDNGMYTFFKKWINGETVIFDPSRNVYPKNVAMNLISKHVAYYNAIIQPYVTFCLDLPTRMLPSKHDPGEEEFHFMLTAYHNINRAKEMSELKKRLYPRVNQYFVFQGYNISQLILILKELMGIEFEGYALPTRSLKWNQMAAIMLMLYHYGAKKIHILAGSNMPAMAVCAFMARHLFDEVSYDSTNWLTYGKNGAIRLFGSMRGLATGEIIEIPECILNAQCGCPHCNGRSIKDYRKMEYGSDKVQLLTKHNAFIEVETAKALYAHSETPDMLRDFLLKHCGSHRTKIIMEIHKCLKLIGPTKRSLGNYDLARGTAELMFQQFHTRY